METLLLRNGILVTMDPARTIVRGDVYVVDRRIAALGDVGIDTADRVLDVSGAAVLPGFVQTHVHLCQTLFRGEADGLELLPWLRQRIWPLEAAHDPESVAASARLGCAELILGGTTTVVDMGTVHHTEQTLEVLAASGLRAFAGKCMMDAGDGVPAGLLETTDRSLRESVDLFERWDGAAGGRIRYAFAPRFILSCTDALLREVERFAADRGALVHAHACENRHECARVEAERGAPTIEHFRRLGLTGPRLLLAHCVHLSDAERATLAGTDTAVAHCPSSNLKLGSGIAPIHELRAAGIRVGLGADGAPCNNNLDALLEMRLASLLQSVRVGPGALPAEAALEMATLGGARALGIDGEIGSLEIGKRADLIAIDLTGPHLAPGAGDSRKVISSIVHAARAHDVRCTIVDGRILMLDGELLTLDVDEVRRGAARALTEVKRRAGLS